PARSGFTTPGEIHRTDESPSIGQGFIVALRIPAVQLPMQTPKSGLLATAFSALLSPVLRYLDKPSQPRYHGEIQLKGLQQTVDVSFDGYAVPRVRAASEQD